MYVYIYLCLSIHTHTYTYIHMNYVYIYVFTPRYRYLGRNQQQRCISGDLHAQRPRDFGQHRAGDVVINNMFFSLSQLEVRGYTLISIDRTHL